MRGVLCEHQIKGLLPLEHEEAIVGGLTNLFISMANNKNLVNQILETTN